MAITLKTSAAVVVLTVLAACQGPSGSLPFSSNFIPRNIDRVALADTSVTIKGRTYVVKRNMVTIASQDPFEAWAIVKDGQTLSCKRATVESCEKALQGEESGGGGDY